MTDKQEKNSVMQAPMTEIYPLIREVVESGGEFRLITAGTSMMPLLGNRRDTVVLIKSPEKLKRLDIPLYRRANGTFVLHRVWAVNEDGTYVTCGDHQTAPEMNVRHEQVVAVAKALIRKGKLIDVSSKKQPLLYRLYLAVWCSSLLPRKVYYKCTAPLRRLKKK